MILDKKMPKKKICEKLSIEKKNSEIYEKDTCDEEKVLQTEP